MSIFDADEQIKKARDYAFALCNGEDIVDKIGVAHSLLVLAEFCKANIDAISQQSLEPERS